MSERMKILIAYDGSTCADDALNDLPRAGLPREADALIVQVEERWLSPPSDYKTVEEVVVTTNAVAAKPARRSRLCDVPRLWLCGRLPALFGTADRPPCRRRSTSDRRHVLRLRSAALPYLRPP